MQLCFSIVESYIGGFLGNDEKDELMMFISGSLDDLAARKKLIKLGETSLDPSSHLSKLPFEIQHMSNTFILSKYKKTHYERNRSFLLGNLRQYNEFDPIVTSFLKSNSTINRYMQNQSFLLFGLGRRREIEKPQLLQEIKGECKSLKVLANSEMINKGVISSEEEKANGLKYCQNRI